MSAISRWAFVVITVVGLGVDAYTHYDLAPNYKGISATVSQGTLFYIEAAFAILAALAVLIRPGIVTAAFAFLVAAGGLALLLLYRYVDVGAVNLLGFKLPNMNDPQWFTEKSESAWGEVAAVVGSLGLLLVSYRESRAAKESVRTAR
jgi:hypothetical protein